MRTEREVMKDEGGEGTHIPERGADKAEDVRTRIRSSSTTCAMIIRRQRINVDHKTSCMLRLGRPAS